MALTEGKTAPPEGLEKMPTSCPICDSMISLGLISATCESLPQTERTKCHQLIKSLEEKKQNALSRSPDGQCERRNVCITDTGYAKKQDFQELRI